MSQLSLSGVVHLISSFPVLSYGLNIMKDVSIAIMKTGPAPKHVALIMDGNRTYAKNNNLPLKEGHNAGAETLIQVLDVCYRIGVKHVTIYAFSIDNFNRSEAEVNTLFEILREKLLALSTHEGSYARINKIRVRIIGKKSLIPEDILRDLENIEKNTRNNISDRVLNVCFPYTSREEITHAMQEVAEKVCNKEITNVKGEDSPITIKLLHDQMYMSGETTPPLDLLIRTSGHTRLSDFMLWQCNSNCTIEFVNTLWPDFKFLGISSLLLKWMYYKTLQLEEKQAVSSSTDRIFQP